jgi:type I restriction enzyme, S subunit
VIGDLLFRNFNRIADGSDGIVGLRQAILDLAVRGYLCEQRTGDGSGSALLKQISHQCKKTAARGPADLSEADGPPLPNIPSTWAWATIDQMASCDPNAITDGPFGANLKTAHYIDQPGFRVIRLENVGHGDFRADLHTYVSRTHWEALHKHHVFEGDLVVAGLVDPSVRACELPHGIGPALVKADCYRFRVHPDYSTRFALYFLNSTVCKGFAAVHHHGMTLTRLGLGNFRRLPIPVPPLAEQQRIVNKVDELMALCDELAAAQTEREARRDWLRATSLRDLVAPDEPKENARFFLRHSARMITKAAHVAGVRQTIWDLAVQGRLVQQDSSDEPAGDWLRRSAEQAPEEVASRSPINGLTAPGWATITLNDLAPTVTSGSRGWAQFYADRGALFVRSQNIKYGSLLMNDRAYVAPPARSEGTRTSIDVGDLLVVITGDVGHVAIWDQNLGEAYVSQHVALVKPFTPKVSRWLLLCLMAPTAGRGQLRSSIYGGKPGLNLNQVRSAVVPLPPLAEQRRIVAKVDELMAVCDELEESLAAEQTERGRLLDALLRDALEDALPARELELLGAR